MKITKRGLVLRQNDEGVASKLRTVGGRALKQYKI